MEIIDTLSKLPSNVKFKVKTSDKPCEDAEYVYFHKSLKYYSCYFNIPVVESRKKRKTKDV